jgi:hypothetical protein
MCEGFAKERANIIDGTEARRGFKGPKYNVQDMSYHLKEHDKASLIYLITEDLLKMEEKIDA